MSTVKELKKDVVKVTENLTPEEAARYFGLMIWNVAVTVATGKISQKEGEARVNDIHHQINVCLKKYGCSEFCRFKAEYHDMEINRMFQSWTMDSLAYIDTIIDLCEICLQDNDLIERYAARQPEEVTCIHEMAEKIAELRDLYGQRKRDILEIAPWERYGMTKPDEKGAFQVSTPAPVEVHLEDPANRRDLEPTELREGK